MRHRLAHLLGLNRKTLVCTGWLYREPGDAIVLFTNELLVATAQVDSEGRHLALIQTQVCAGC